MTAVKTVAETEKIISQLKAELEKGKLSGEEKGWLSAEEVRERLTARYGG